MGVFDFLYKSRPRPERVHPRSYHQQRPSSQYQQRTTTYVNNRSNSLPSEQEPVARNEARHYDRKSPSTRSYNQKHDTSHQHKYHHQQQKPKVDTVDYYRTSRANDFEDDFTRLSRLEVKIDNYIKRHNQLSVELNAIERDLGLILNEFNDEFQDSIVKSDNRHTREIGERILDKLNSFCSIDNSIELVEPVEVTKKKEKAHTRALSPTNLPKSRKSSTESDQSNRIAVSRANKVLATSPPQVPTATLPTSPLVNSHNGHYRKNRDFTFNMTGIEKQNENFGAPNLVKAHYAVVNTSTPYAQDTVTRPTHYKSTPSLVHANQALPYDSPSQFAVDDSYLNDPNQSRMYINMSMVMHSDHPVIEHCFRRIEILRPRIMGYKSEHKLSVYKELDTEIIRLMNRLETVDCSNNSISHQDKNIALCELHNLAGVLERAIDCTDPECVICNSFIYKQEVSV